MVRDTSTRKSREGSAYMSDVDNLTADRARIDNNILPYNVVRTSNALISDAGSIIPVDTSSNVVTITLASSMVETGSHLIIKDSVGSAGTNNITVDTEGSETIDGATSVSITGNYGSVEVVSDGTNWLTL